MSLIKNKAELCGENPELRTDALAILEAGLQAIDTEKVLRKKISFENGAFCVNGQNIGVGFQCDFYKRIFFIGIGKCALDGAKVVEEILGDHLTDGIVLDVRVGALKKIKSYAGTHPYPSEVNKGVTEQILHMVEGVTEEDLVLVLVSGGGSSLLCLPHEMNCEAFAKITEELMQKGADIYELNTVRKHLSEVQGGGLAKILFPAQVVSLIFSDVLGNDISVVASGPTVLDNTTIEDAQKVLQKYEIKIDERLLIETPKDQKYFKNTRNFLAVSNKDALSAIKTEAERLGYKAKIETETLSGNASKVGKEIASRDLEPKTCVIFGGETTVEVKSGGVGGRNQELVLSALPSIKNNCLLISVASDGWDNTDHAGAMADKFIFEKSQKLGLDPQKFLAENNSYDFWKEVGGAICTGRLGSNVSDLVIILTK